MCERPRPQVSLGELVLGLLLLGAFLGLNIPVTVWYFETTHRTSSNSEITRYVVVSKERANYSRTNAGWPLVFHKDRQQFGVVSSKHTETNLTLALINLFLFVAALALLRIGVKRYAASLQEPTEGGFP